jgi:hypothetical protein
MYVKDETTIQDVSFLRLCILPWTHMSVTETYVMHIFAISILFNFSWRGSQWPVLAAVTSVYHFFLLI